MEIQELLTTYNASGVDDKGQDIWGNVLIMKEPAVSTDGSIKYYISQFLLYSDSGYFFDGNWSHEGQESYIEFGVGQPPETISVQDAQWTLNGHQRALLSDGCWEIHPLGTKWDNDQTGVFFKNSDGTDIGDTTFPNRVKYETLPDIIELYTNDNMTSGEIFGPFVPKNCTFIKLIKM